MMRRCYVIVFSILVTMSWFACAGKPKPIEINWTVTGEDRGTRESVSCEGKLIPVVSGVTTQIAIKFERFEDNEIHFSMDLMDFQEGDKFLVLEIDAHDIGWRRYSNYAFDGDSRITFNLDWPLIFSILTRGTVVDVHFNLSYLRVDRECYDCPARLFFQKESRLLNVRVSYPETAAKCDMDKEVFTIGSCGLEAQQFVDLYCSLNRLNSGKLLQVDSELMTMSPFEFAEGNVKSSFCAAKRIVDYLLNRKK